MDKKSELYSKRQERLLKERFYRWVLNACASSEKKLNWEMAARELGNITGVNIPAESLRQNIMPKNRKAGQPPRRFSDPARFQALHRFLIHESIRYLSDNELDQAAVDNGAAIALFDFLNPGEGSYDASMMAVLKGRFVCVNMTETATEYTTLDIECSSQNSIVTVVERNVQEADEQKNAASNDEESLSGWAVGNKFGFYQIFMRDVYTGAICSYQLIQTSPGIQEAKPINAIVLLRYDSAWGHALNIVTDAINEEKRIIDVELPKSIGSMCRVLTRE